MINPKKGGHVRRTTGGNLGRRRGVTPGGVERSAVFPDVVNVGDEEPIPDILSSRS